MTLNVNFFAVDHDGRVRGEMNRDARRAGAVAWPDFADRDEAPSAENGERAVLGEAEPARLIVFDDGEPDRGVEDVGNDNADAAAVDENFLADFSSKREHD